MNLDEFAFFNQQLAAMLRDGIPLEGALRQLVAGMRAGPLRDELQKLEADLATGTPFQRALRARRLPEFYVTMLEVGAQSNNLPGVLTLLADHYRHCHTLLTRLKGLMVYPLIVLVGAFGLSCLLSFVLMHLFWPNFKDLIGTGYPFSLSLLALWTPPALLGLAVSLAIIAVGVPAFRRGLRWRLPAFRETALSQIASAFALMLRGGVALDRAIALAEQLERGTVAGLELAQWRARLAAGHGKLTEFAQPGRAFTPLFVWLVGQGGEDLAAGFARAAELYRGRAA
ncbi:MAG: type II secretion system F family protein [Verrucomicrobiae bacterium]|nr:type II secretion system F family protein [Verrucomicrobiae bacterium]